MHLILFDDHSWDNLLPLTFTRPVSELRIGILTIREKWEKILGMQGSYITRAHLSNKYPCAGEQDNLLVNGSLLPDKDVEKEILNLARGQALKKGATLLGIRGSAEILDSFEPGPWLQRASEYVGDISLVDFPWKIFSLNGQEIEADFELLTRDRAGSPLSKSVDVLYPERIFAEPGFRGEYITLNATSGPIYLGADSEIMEGSRIRGPFALCEGAIVKMSAKIYGPTTIGPYSKVGGEINNSVVLAHSNKAHDGFLGNSVLGEWCNLGADTNNSNLKNNYAEVQIWNYPQEGPINTGRQFCGLIMGDHSKCGINTMFNTGTVVGVAANIFGPGFPATFIPSFSWGGASRFVTYRMEKMLETAALVMGRRGYTLSDDDLQILEYIFRYSERFRQGT